MKNLTLLEENIIWRKNYFNNCSLENKVGSGRASRILSPKCGASSEVLGLEKVFGPFEYIFEYIFLF